jgi:hypothetical protein
MAQHSGWSAQVVYFYFLFPINNCTAFISNQHSDRSADGERPSGWLNSELGSVEEEGEKEGGVEEEDLEEKI